MLKFIPVGILLFLSWPGLLYYTAHFYLYDELNTVVRTGKLMSTRLNPKWFIYPTLQMYLLFVIYGVISVTFILLGNASFADIRMFFQNNPTVYIISGRLVSFFSTALCAILIYKIAELYLSKTIALLPAIIFVVLKPVIYLSHIIKPDAIMMFLMMFSVYLFLKSENNSNYWPFFIIGLATGAKYNAGAIVLLMMILACSSGFSLKRFFLQLLAASIGFIITTPFAIITPDVFLSDLNKLSGMIKESGHIYYLGFSNSFLYAIRHGLGGIFGSFGVFLICIFFPLSFFYIHSRKFLLIPLSAVISFYVYLKGSIPHVNYLYLGLPFICLAVFFPWSNKKIKYSVPQYFSFFVCFCIVSTSIIPTLKWKNLLLKRDSRHIAREWIFKNAKSGDTIFLENDVPPISSKSIPSCNRYKIVKIPVYYSNVTDPNWMKSIRKSYKNLLSHIMRKSDFVIINGWNIGPVYKNSKKFPEKYGFYESLKKELILKKEIVVPGIGPTIYIYQNKAKH